MRTLIKTFSSPISVFALVIALIAPFSASASEPIGLVLLSVGKVIATDASGTTRDLQRRSKIFQGDIITTEEGSRIQIRFSDRSLLALPALSQFRIDQYEFGAEEATNEKAIYSLLKGGMRTITGAIGKKNPEDYQLNTPVATIGIRGTAYHAYLHRLPSGEIQLFGGVNSGMIIISNAAGSKLFSRNQNFRVLSANDLAEILLHLPDFYPSQEEGDEQKEPLFDDLLGNPLLNEILQTSDDTDGATPVSSTLAPSGSLVAVSFVRTASDGGSESNSKSVINTAPNAIYLDTVNGIDNIPVGVNVYDSSCNPCTFVPGTATLSETGSNASLGVNWGRWNGDFVVVENGQLEQTSGSFHYLYTDNITPLSTVQARTGYFSYNLAGGTNPTDHLGNVGTLGSFDMDIDFTNQTVAYAFISGSAGSVSFAANSSGTTPILDAINPEIGVAINDASNGLTGTINMQFVGSNADGIAASYGMEDVNKPSARTVTGTALLIDSGGGG